MNYETDLEHLLSDIRHVRDMVGTNGTALLNRWEPRLRREEFRASATNMAHFLALRSQDLRSVQRGLVRWGLSSLARCESRVLPTLDAVIANLEMLCRANAEPRRPEPGAFRIGAESLKRNTEEIFGPPPEGRVTRILVTLSADTATNPDRARELVAAGMDCARVNCAHESPKEWLAMIENVRAAAAEAGRTCRILMDLAGPKIRTRFVTVRKKDKKVRAGDRILLSFEKPNTDSDIDFQAACSLADVLRQVNVGAKASIKDGLIQGEISDVRPEGIVMVVTRTPPDGQSLKNEKGINFPQTDLILSPLTKEDLKALDFAAEHADIISYSFVQRPEDIAALQSEITARRPNKPEIPIVAKIETRLAFANLPELIVQASGSNPFAVMIARGDLAVEIGYERLSEIQEEILWLCEAASVPVIWATQVLESLVKRGMPSRGEFTDAAMAERAECVMLNKGPYIAEGITVLDDVLRRMETHKDKRATRLRPLKAWMSIV